MFRTEMKPGKCLAKEKNRARKAKAEGRRESKRKIQDCGVTLNQKNCLEILLSVHAQTLETCVLCLEQKAAKCLTYKQGFGLTSLKR